MIPKGQINMHNSDEICKKQNEEINLKRQFAAREYYNSAETINYWIIILVILSLVSLFLDNILDKNFHSIFLFIIDIAIFTLYEIRNNNVAKAATIRELFDDEVLGFNRIKKTQSESNTLQEYVLSICEANPDKTNVQITNNGKDKIPGVRDWYCFQKPIDKLEAQLECQRQNIWWNNKLFKLRIILLFIFLFLGFILFVIGFIYSDNKLNIFLSFIGFSINIDFVYGNYKYFILSKKIEGCLATVELSKNKQSIEKLQDYINEKRKLYVLECNFLHKLLANKLTNDYEKITSK